MGQDSRLRASSTTKTSQYGHNSAGSARNKVLLLCAAPNIVSAALTTPRCRAMSRRQGGPQGGTLAPPASARIQMAPRQVKKTECGVLRSDPSREPRPPPCS